MNINILKISKALVFFNLIFILGAIFYTNEVFVFKGIFINLVVIISSFIGALLFAIPTIIIYKIIEKNIDKKVSYAYFSILIIISFVSSFINVLIIQNPSEDGFSYAGSLMAQFTILLLGLCMIIIYNFLERGVKKWQKSR